MSVPGDLSITVTVELSTEVGSCNGCSGNVDPDTYRRKPHKVAQVQLKTLTFRLCRDCLQQFRESIRSQNIIRKL